MDGFHTWIPSVIETAQPMKTRADAEAYIARLQAMPRYFQNHVDSLRQGLREGRAAVQIAVERAMRQLEELTKTSPEQTPYANVIKKLPEDLRARYEPRILEAVRSSVYPAHESYLKFLKEEYSAKARGDDKPGLFYVAGSSGAYSYLIRLHTTLDKAPAELYKAGMDELASIHAEMGKIAKRRGHTGDLKSFFEKMRKDPDNFFKTRQDVLETTQRLVAKTQEKLPQYFGRLPKTPLIVKAIEGYKEKHAIAAYYYPPPDDLSRPGVYYVNTYQPETRPRFSMAALAVHEGLPGHHLQIALALEKRDLPAFRRNGGFNSFVEGWALYSERLAEEMGLYPDDLSRLGMLSFQAWRACRLVVDTGLHARGWARWRTIDFMKQNTPMSEEEIIAEVDRYIVIPGQALAYKVGQREILALRRESRALLKQKFDLRAFHDRVLENGALPLTTLRRIVLNPY
ncbi:MAG: DUF885 domain-containing protein, partial [Elusimicrobia bacterium]|nr:DUF885 domain-containing protein [Elusimicrobiota bacterium]